jgi:hypothetical protein
MVMPVCRGLLYVNRAIGAGSVFIELPVTVEISAGGRFSSGQGRSTALFSAVKFSFHISSQKSLS